ncbi:hypothetical protein SGPA1_30824 [Streptomyces misionensis JCM 4497]
MGAARHRHPGVERPQAAGAGDAVRQPDDHRPAARRARGAAAPARRLADAAGEPGGGARLRRLRLADRRQEDVVQLHRGPRGAAGALRRRLRLPLRRRLVSGHLRRRPRHRGGRARLQHRHAGPADGLAGRRTAGHAPDAGAGPGHRPQGHLDGHGRLPGAGGAALPRPACAVGARAADAARPGRQGGRRPQGGPRADGGRLHGRLARGRLAHPGRGAAGPGARPAEQRRAARRAGGLAPAGLRGPGLGAGGLPGVGAVPGGDLVPDDLPAGGARRRRRVRRTDAGGRSVPRVPGADLPQRLEPRAVHQQRGPAAHVRAAQRHPADAGREHAGAGGALGVHDVVGTGDGTAVAAGPGARRDRGVGGAVTGPLRPRVGAGGRRGPGGAIA